MQMLKQPRKTALSEIFWTSFTILGHADLFLPFWWALVGLARVYIFLKAGIPLLISDMFAH
jgi:hypothetical protein